MQYFYIGVKFDLFWNICQTKAITLLSNSKEWKSLSLLKINIWNMWRTHTVTGDKKGDQVEATLPGLSMLVKSSTFMALCAHSLEDNTNKKFSLKWLPGFLTTHLKSASFILSILLQASFIDLETFAPFVLALKIWAFSSVGQFVELP